MLTRLKKRMGLKRRLQSPKKAPGTPVSDFINDVSLLLNLRNNYLEIGVEYGFTFEAVYSGFKTAVDPNIRFQKWPGYSGISLRQMTSDDFFGANSLSSRYDLVFIDGLHTAEQTWRDLKNVSAQLTSNSVVIIDDTIPCDEFSTELTSDEAYKLREEAGISGDYRWHGDVYKVVLKLIRDVPDIQIATINDVPNPFTVCWNVTNIHSKNDDIPTEQYSQIFSDGIPEAFMPMSKNQLLSILGE